MKFAWKRLVIVAIFAVAAAFVPKPPSDKPVRLFTVPQYTEGVVFDHDGIGYISHGKTITRFTPDDGEHAIWAETGGPNGHKILADGTHLVCDHSHRAVLHLGGRHLPVPRPVLLGRALPAGGRRLPALHDVDLHAAGRHLLDRRELLHGLAVHRQRLPSPAAAGRCGHASAGRRGCVA